MQIRSKFPIPIKIINNALMGVENYDGRACTTINMSVLLGTRETRLGKTSRLQKI